MKKILFLLLLLLPQVAVAVPQAGVNYTYQTIANNPNDVLRLPDKVMIPLNPTGAVNHREIDNGDKGIVKIDEFVSDPENEDLVAYKAWLKKGNKPTAYTPPVVPAPVVDERVELKKQLEILQLKAQVKSLQNGGK